MLAFVLLGSLAYYTYTVANTLGERNSKLDLEVAALQVDISVLRENITILRASIASMRTNVSSVQTSLLLTSSAESKDAQQIAAVQTMLQNEQLQLSMLNSELGNLSATNANSLASMSAQLRTVSASVQELRANLSALSSAIFLRTSGLALGAYVEDADGETYLRLMETGSSSLVEASLASYPFNATIPGTMVEWRAVANNVSADPYHWFWPMVLENTPGGTNALEFEDAGGAQEVAVVSNGVRNVVPVKWSPTVIHTFGIKVVTPGHEVDFYIDGVVVADVTSGIPMVSFLLEGAEVKGTGTNAPGVAILDAYGGLLGSD